MLPPGLTVVSERSVVPLSPKLSAAVATLFCSSLPRHLAGAQQLTSITLSLLEAQLAALCWHKELGLPPKQVARAGHPAAGGTARPHQPGWEQPRCGGWLPEVALQEACA